MREITVFLHSQKINRPEPVISRAILRLAAGLRSVFSSLGQGSRTALR
jgi:hypothetical protein